MADATDTALVSSTNHYLDTERTPPTCWKCSGTGSLPTKPASPRDPSEPAQRKQCPVCKGFKHIAAQPRVSSKPAVRPFKKPPPVGPPACFALTDPEVAPGPGEFLSSLCGSWGIYQIVDGHRYTTDDVCTAMVAYRHLARLHAPHPPTVEKHLDIGTGLSSVLLMTAHRFHTTLKQSVGVEAQTIHVRLAQRSIALNGLAATASIRHGDLRDLARGDPGGLIPEGAVFDLVTGTPPYFPAAEGALPTVAGRGQCAFELRGGCEVYFDAAARFMAPGPRSRFVVCQTSREIRRMERAAKASGLRIMERWDVYGREGKAGPLFCVFCAARPDPDEAVGQGYDVRTLFVLLVESGRPLPE
ncbi:hypothetical protein BDK51DRAFT_33639 [Blyttiomyces helicus]|uniref:S-adenosyl-L-methionine-dependent methyltransferase n=1 Tax=Blyttiomyces helicus TaxID=388810 RepID=A0A4P9WP80_9FUNG|nr:hypothetical protein BDK51DRAFT_33639 [Blyttiomyces helicus]|eukprot:RKO94115.1 hypothetical protein BDK51DRAFT_33639 [Blyttiomyces helicus]